MYVRAVDIENLRTFERARIELNVPGESDVGSPGLSNITVLLGDNGAGKTTILRAIALAALAPALASGSGYVPYSMVRRVGGKALGPARLHAELILHEQDGTPGEREVTLEILPTSGFVDRFAPVTTPSWAEPMWEEGRAAFLMVGYGASRRSDLSSGLSEENRQKSRMLRYARVAGLFEEAVTMTPLSAWFARWAEKNPGRHRQVLTLLNDLLRGHAEILEEPVEGEYLFRAEGSTLPFQALSDGFRAYIGWIADLLYHVCLGAPSGARLVENRGVVLVDEVDLHLHPAWQQVVIPTVAQTLPAMQVVLTSHSPLVVGTLRRKNVFVLRPGDAPGAPTTLEPSQEEVFGLSADQILTGAHFGLSSTRDPGFASELRKQALSAKEGGSEAALRLLRMMTLGGAEPRDASPPTPQPPAQKKSAQRTAPASSRVKAPPVRVGASRAAKKKSLAPKVGRK